MDQSTSMLNELLPLLASFQNEVHVNVDVLEVSGSWPNWSNWQPIPRSAATSWPACRRVPSPRSWQDHAAVSSVGGAEGLLNFRPRECLAGQPLHHRRLPYPAQKHHA